MSKIPLWLRYLLAFIAVLIISSILQVMLFNFVMFKDNAESSEAKAGEFTVYDAEGNVVKLSDFRGKPVILNIWTSWSKPCQDEMPYFQKAYEEYGDEIQFLMVNLTDGSRETQEIAIKYMESQGYTMPILFDKDRDAAAAYAVFSIPATFFIDELGFSVTWYNKSLSEENLQAGIDKLLNFNKE